MYYEFLAHDRESVKEIAESLGIHMDWEQYTPLISYFPAVIYGEGGPEHDLIAFSYRDVLHTGSMTAEIPWIDELSETNPYTYNIAMNVETARKKGLHEGDIIWVENIEDLVFRYWDQIKLGFKLLIKEKITNKNAKTYAIVNRIERFAGLVQNFIEVKNKTNYFEDQLGYTVQFYGQPKIPKNIFDLAYKYREHPVGIKEYVSPFKNNKKKKHKGMVIKL